MLNLHLPGHAESAGVLTSLRNKSRHLASLVWSDNPNIVLLTCVAIAARSGHKVCDPACYPSCHCTIFTRQLHKCGSVNFNGDVKVLLLLNQIPLVWQYINLPPLREPSLHCSTGSPHSKTHSPSHLKRSSQLVALHKELWIFSTPLSPPPFLLFIAKYIQTVTLDYWAC